MDFPVRYSQEQLQTTFILHAKIMMQDIEAKHINIINLLILFFLSLASLREIYRNHY